MKPVVCYAVAAMPFAKPGSAAIADLLAIGFGGILQGQGPDGFSEKEFDPGSFNSLLCPDSTNNRGQTTIKPWILMARARRPKLHKGDAGFI